MSKLKKWIIILTIVCITIFAILIYAVYQNRAEIIYGIEEQGSDIEYNIDSTLQKVSIRNDYYVVKTCVNKFYLYYASIYNIEKDYYIIDEEVGATIQEEKAQNIKAVYNMLDDEYKKCQDITLDNLTTKLPEINGMLVNINDMYISQKTNNIDIYFVYGKLTDTSTAQSCDFSMIVKVDMLNETFKVLLKDYIDKNYADIKVGENVDINYQEAIEDNEYNKFEYEPIDDETYVKDIFQSLRDNMIYNKQIAYDSLDEEYRAKRFPTLEKFEQYVKNNIRNISVMKLSKYQKNRNEDSVQYVCLDTNNKYYIINEISTMNCTFILDTYTIDLPEFLAKYEEAEDTNKVALNIEKVNEAINVKDFEYVYNKLDNSFKNNKFGNYANLENYLKSNFFEKNIFEYKRIEEQAGVYIATVIVKNKENMDETKEIRIIMKLGEGTDFVMSFSGE